MKILFVAVITFSFYVDFPDRLTAEKEKSLKATVTGYHENKISMRSRYYVEAKAEDGKIYRNTDGWSPLVERGLCDRDHTRKESLHRQLFPSA